MQKLTAEEFLKKEYPATYITLCDERMKNIVTTIMDDYALYILDDDKNKKVNEDPIIPEEDIGV